MKAKGNGGKEVLIGQRGELCYTSTSARPGIQYRNCLLAVIFSGSLPPRVRVCVVAWPGPFPILIFPLKYVGQCQCRWYRTRQMSGLHCSPLTAFAGAGKIRKKQPVFHGRHHASSAGLFHADAPNIDGTECVVPKRYTGRRYERCQRGAPLVRTCARQG